MTEYQKTLINALLVRYSVYEYVANFPGEGLPFAGEVFHVDNETLRLHAKGGCRT